MQLLTWLPGEGEGLLVFAGMLLIWAQALYVTTRGGGRLVAVLTALGMATFAVYLLGLWEGALAFPETPSRWIGWLRATWWSTCIAPALWLLLILVLAGDEGHSLWPVLLRRFRSGVIASVLGLAAAIAVVGVTSELVLRWSDAVPTLAPLTFGSDALAWHLPPGP